MTPNQATINTLIKFGEYRSDLVLVFAESLVCGIGSSKLSCKGAETRGKNSPKRVSQMLIYDSSITSVVRMPSLEGPLIVQNDQRFIKKIPKGGISVTR